MLLKFLIQEQHEVSCFPALRITTVIGENLRFQLLREKRSLRHARPGHSRAPGRARPRPHLAPQKGLDAALVGAGHHHTRTLSVFVFLEERKKVSSTSKHTACPSDPANVSTRTQRKPSAHCYCPLVSQHSRDARMGPFIEKV